MHVCRGLFGAKTLSYAVMHFVVAILVAYALTLDWRKALAIGIVEPIVQTFAFAVHDRYWTRREAAPRGETGGVHCAVPAEGG